MKYWIPCDESVIKCPLTSGEVSPANLVRAMRRMGIDVSTEYSPPDRSERVWIGKANPTGDAVKGFRDQGVFEAAKRVWMAGGITEQSWLSYRVWEVKEFLNACDLIVCPTEYEKQILLHRDIRSPVVVLPQPIGEQFEYHERNGSKEPTMFLTVASLNSWRKGAWLLAAIFEIWKGGVLTILSPYSGVKYFDNCEYVRVVRTAIPNTELPEFFKLFDVYIHMGLTETYNMTAYEALATGMPCIVPRTPAMVQWIPEEYWPYMVEMSDLYLLDARDAGHVLMRLPELYRLIGVLNHVKRFYADALEKARRGSEIVRRYMSAERWIKAVESILKRGDPVWQLRRIYGEI